MIEYSEILNRFKLLVATNRSKPSADYIEEVLPQCEFIKDIEIPGVYYKVIGTPSVIYTAHYDTAGDSDVELISNPNLPHVVRNKNVGILGADDKAGLTVLSFMIEHNVPGLYLLFGDEESGASQSKRWADTDFYTKYGLVKDSIVSAIAFDRKGYSDTIQTQRGTICCSMQFAGALSTVLAMGGLSYRPASGVYTDTANMIYVIPECTNLSIGYDSAHTSSENQDILFLFRIVNFMLTNHEAIVGIPSGKTVETKPVYTSYASKYAGFTGHGVASSRNTSSYSSRGWTNHDDGMEVYDEYTQSWVPSSATDDTDWNKRTAGKKKTITLKKNIGDYPAMQEHTVFIAENSVIDGYIHEYIEEKSLEYAKDELMVDCIYDSLGTLYVDNSTLDIFCEGFLETVYSSDTSVDIMYRGQVLRLLASVYDIVDEYGYMYIASASNIGGTIVYPPELKEYDYEWRKPNATKRKATNGNVISLFKDVHQEEGEAVGSYDKADDFVL